MAVTTLSAGALRFARYAYPPNELGYCGPAGAGEFMGITADDAEAEVRRRARRFEGAWHYLEVIAASAGIDDPLDDRVVEAYWVGNELLDSLDPDTLLAELRVRFRGQTTGTWNAAGVRARAHHSFQVFEVYPWVSLLGGRDDRVPMNVLEQCRIRTGSVVAVEGERATVRTSPLEWDGVRLSLGDERDEQVRWSDGGQGLLDSVSVGDLVALHWDWVCDVL
ncbi:MAG: DUF6390 family protein, partial [Nocardioidaceae bacterium]